MKNLIYFTFLFSLSINLSFAGDNCQNIAKELITSPKKGKSISSISSATPQGLPSELNQTPKVLFINPGANGIGFDDASLTIVRYFIENTKEAEIIIPSTEVEFSFLPGMEHTKKDLVDFLLQEQSAKRIKLHFLFKGNEAPADSITWTRDYAPVKIFNKKTRKYELIAFSYAPGTPKNPKDYNGGMRFTEDIQQGIADVLKLKLKRSTLIIEGGNMLSDQSGNVFISTKVLEINAEKTKVQIENELLALGLGEKIIWLTKIPREIEPTGHVDLAIRFLNPSTVAVPKSTNKKIAPHLDRLAKEMQDNGFKVERLAMSPSIVNIINGNKTIPSPMNALEIGNDILIPKFGTKYDEEAKNFYQSFGYNVKFVTGDTMQMAGSVHCMTYTY